MTGLNICRKHHIDIPNLAVCKPIGNYRLSFTSRSPICVTFFLTCHPSVTVQYLKTRRYCLFLVLILFYSF